MYVYICVYCVFPLNQLHYALLLHNGYASRYNSKAYRKHV